MFFRKKRVQSRVYLQIVENRWEGGRSKQRVLATLGRIENLQAGKLDALLESGSRFSDSLMAFSAHQAGDAPAVSTRRIGPGLVFERLWDEVGCRAVLSSLLSERKFEIPVERAIFIEVLHRLMAPGSDRSCFQWKDSYRIAGAEDLSLHHAYRAMAWLGEEVEDTAAGAEPSATLRCTKDLVEEQLFDRRRDLFSHLDLVFFDTTSLYFEGEGGETLGERGHSKDHRPDLKQMVVGVVLDDQGWPICCELWPGNTADVSSLIPVVERLERRFGIRNICVVADRGMIKKATIAALEEKGWFYILGARMRSRKEIRDVVLSRPGRYHEVHGPRVDNADPSPLRVKNVKVEDRRYIVCSNEEQARKDAADREAILANLDVQLRQGAKAMVGNRGFREYLKTVERGALQIDTKKVESEARYDGKWVLATNMDLPAAEIALKYRLLWQVEDVFRTTKSILATRPVFHKTDQGIRGHVFCSFLALLLRKELMVRLERLQDKKPEAEVEAIEWASMLRDLDALEEVDICHRGKTFRLRTEARGATGTVFRAVGVALPPTIQAVA